MGSLYARIVAAITIVCAVALLSVGWYASRATLIELDSVAPPPSPELLATIASSKEPLPAVADRYNLDILVTTPALAPIAASWGTLAPGDVVKQSDGSLLIHRRSAGHDEALVLRGGFPIRHGTITVAELFTIPRHAVAPAAPSFLRVLWISVGVAISAAAVVALLLGRSIAGPVRELAAASTAMARGDLDRRVRPGSGELGALARSFNRMADAVERTETLRRRMVTDVAHELRSPLTRIRALVEAVEDGHRTSDEVIPQIFRDARNLERLVDDLRDLSLADAGQLDLHRREVDVGECIADVVRDMRVAGTSPVEILVDVSADLPPVTADPQRLAQVLRNLLDNATRYARNHVVVGAASDDRFVECFVQDDGPGIAASELSDVFERFYRTDASRARATGGSGLGLAIVKELVEAQNGSVSAHSTVGEGSRFTVRLPLATAPARDS